MEGNEILTNEQLEAAANAVKIDIKYGPEAEIIDAAFKKFPKNNDKAIVAMKISLIDLTNGTNLIKNLGKDGGLNKLADKITKINFDERVKKGDITLVEELAEWTKKEIGKNLFSFISKYCLYHNVHCYNKDDYVIYDSIVCENLSRYITNSEYKKITEKKLYKNSWTKLKDTYNYHEYIKIIDYIIEKNKISVDKPHRKLDWAIWFPNRENNTIDKNKKKKMKNK